MNLILSGRGVDLDDSLRRYATDKLTRVQRFFDRIIKMEVELRHERNPRVNDRVEVTVRTPGETLRVHGEGADHFAAIDMAADRLEIQVKKHKERLIDRSHGNGRRPPVPTVADRDEAEENAAGIVRVRPLVSKPLMPEEARLELEDRRLHFLMFTNAETMRPAVLYRRDAGDLGLIEHEG